MNATTTKPDARPTVYTFGAKAGAFFKGFWKGAPLVEVAARALRNYDLPTKDRLSYATRIGTKGTDCETIFPLIPLEPDARVQHHLARGAVVGLENALNGYWKYSEPSQFGAVAAATLSHNHALRVKDAAAKLLADPQVTSPGRIVLEELIQLCDKR